MLEGWKMVRIKRMAEPDQGIEAGLRIEEPSWPVLDEELLLAAAVAAAMVDYRRQARQGNYSNLQDTRATWRTLGRWTQLAGRG